MGIFNYLNGSTIETQNHFLMRSFLDEQCFLGFSRGTPELQWGINSLVLYEPIEIGSLNRPQLTSYVKKSLTDDSVNENVAFYDLNCQGYDKVSLDFRRMVSIVSSNDENLNVIENLDESFSDIRVQFIGESWVILEGLPGDFYNKMDLQKDYYILNFQRNKTYALKILKKSFTNIPFFSQNCSLWWKINGNWVELFSNLQRTINILGEQVVSGLNIDNFNTKIIINAKNNGINVEIPLNENSTEAITTAKNLLLSAGSNFQIRDGAIVLIDGLEYIDPGFENIFTSVINSTGESRYLNFNYNLNGRFFHLKIVIGPKETEGFAIWNEELPFYSIVPVSDSNPPALDISYLRNASIFNSIFDVMGFSKIKSDEFYFCKEIFQDIEKYTAAGFEIEDIIIPGSEARHSGITKNNLTNGMTKIDLKDGHNFVIGDKIILKENPFISYSPTATYTVTDVNYSTNESFINITPPLNLSANYPLDFEIFSEESNISALIKIAKTRDLNKALLYNFYNIYINKSVPLVGINSPTEEVYRQLFICINPKDQDGNTIISDVFKGSNFNRNTYTYDNGTIIYLANKVPVYRKWASTNENFKIII